MTEPADLKAATRATSAVERAFDRAAGGPPVPGNRVTLLQDGPEVYASMLRLIAEAKRWIHFENYIIRDDRTGKLFAEALATRARQGLPVKLLYDWLGSVSTSRRFWRFLREAGVEVRCFNPPTLLKVLGNISRDHRKVLVTDGNRAVVGGLCIGDEWSGDQARNLAPWRDTAVEIAGPVSQVIDDSFARVWTSSGAPLPEGERRSDVAERGGAAVRVVMGEPGQERAYRVLEYLAAGCGSRLWITDAYLVPPPRLFTVLVEAARDGADIRLLVPGTSDLALVRNLTRIGYRDLLRAGIRIFEWDGPMLHAKTAVMDGRWVRVGSSNLNASSLLGNYECDVVIQDQELGRAMEGRFRKDLVQSQEVLRQPYKLGPRLGRIAPSRLTRQSTGPHPIIRQRTARSFRGRTAITARTLISGAWRSIFGPLSIGLIALGVLFFGAPRVTAYFFGVICVWFSVAAALEAWRRRSD
jgi:cardiolipin synthase